MDLILTNKQICYNAPYFPFQRLLINQFIVTVLYTLHAPPSAKTMQRCPPGPPRYPPVQQSFENEVGDADRCRTAMVYQS